MTYHLDDLAAHLLDANIRHAFATKQTEFPSFPKLRPTVINDEIDE